MSLPLFDKTVDFKNGHQHQLHMFDVIDHFNHQIPGIWPPTDERIINGGIILVL